MSSCLSAPSNYLFSSSLWNAGEGLYNSGQTAAAVHSKTSRCREAMSTAQSILGLPVKIRDAISAPLARLAGRAISYFAEPYYVGRAEKLAEKTMQAAQLKPQIHAACDAIAVAGSILNRLSIARRIFASEASVAAMGAGTLCQVAGSLLQGAENMATERGHITGEGVRNKLKTLYVNQVKEVALSGITTAVQVAVINPFLISGILSQTPDQIKSLINAAIDAANTGSMGITALQGTYYLLAFGPCVWCAAKVSWAYLNRSSQVEQVKQNLARLGLQGLPIDAGILALLETQSYALSQVTNQSEKYVQQFCDATTLVPAIAASLGLSRI